mgnify:CR=1 FL=1
MSGQEVAVSRRRLREAEVGAYVARRVRELRLARVTTQEELAAMVGVKRESMSRYESGERAITIALLLDIAAALEHPVEAFLPGHAGDHRAGAPRTPDPGLGSAPGVSLAEVVAMLRQRPDLVPSVLDLLAVLGDDTGPAGPG